MKEDIKSLLLSECANQLGCSTKTIGRLLDDGVLAGYKVRGRRRVLASSWAQYKKDIVLQFQLDHGPAKYPGDVDKRDKSAKGDS